MAYIPLIDTDTGEIDHFELIQRADLRACQQYGGPHPPPAYIRNAISWCTERARSERLEWRRAHGLPDDSMVVMVSLPTWGNSGESFTR